jgi:hypothetical protein
VSHFETVALRTPQEPRPEVTDSDGTARSSDGPPSEIRLPAPCCAEGARPQRRGSEEEMSGRDALLALGSGILGAVVAYGATRLSHGHSDATPAVSPVATESAGGGKVDEKHDAAVDPAMVANANLVRSLYECSQRETSLLEAKARVEADGTAEADAGHVTLARRIARRDLSQGDWKKLAVAGTIRYALPCASFDPTPDVLARLSLAPRDVPAVRSAFAAARDSAWARVQPSCATAVGPGAANMLGLDLCPQVILESEKAASPADADTAMRAVGAVRAGLVDPSAIPAGDPVGNAFLALTGVAKDAEARLASLLGPENARAVVYGNGACSRISEFSSPVLESGR